MHPIPTPPASGYDLVVMGGGSGGVACARRAAAHGARVALVEQDRLGGTCVIRGCVPKKLMMYASRLGAELAEAQAWGWTVADPHFDMSHWQAAKGREIDRLEGIYGQLLDSSGVQVWRGRAVARSATSVEVTDASGAVHVLHTRRLVIATGGSPSRDAVPGIDQAMTSTEVLDLDHLPPRVGIIGAGFIALEFAGILRGLGSAVDVFYRGDWPLRGFDGPLRQRLAAALIHQGIRLHPNSELLQAGANAIVTTQGQHEFDAVLNATGRHPNTRGLGLEQLGIALDAMGAVPVDAYSRTVVPNVFAIGDVTNRKNLTPVAIAEGRAVADNAFAGTDRTVHHAGVPAAVFTQPPIGTVGLTEEQAASVGRVRVYESEFRPMKTAFAGGTIKTYMKLLVDDASDRVLGIHMLGDDAPEIVQSLAVAYVMGATKADFDRTVAVHPTAAEEFVLMREPTRVVGP